MNGVLGAPGAPRTPFTPRTLFKGNCVSCQIHPGGSQGLLVELQKKKEYINQRQWIRECKTRWGFKKERAKLEWKEMLADATVPKGKDQMGWLTMPALHVFSSGRPMFVRQHTSQDYFSVCVSTFL